MSSVSHYGQLPGSNITMMAATSESSSVPSPTAGLATEVSLWSFLWGAPRRLAELPLTRGCTIPVTPWCPVPDSAFIWPHQHSWCDCQLTVSHRITRACSHVPVLSRGTAAGQNPTGTFAAATLCWRRFCSRAGYPGPEPLKDLCFLKRCLWKLLWHSLWIPRFRKKLQSSGEQPVPAFWALLRGVHRCCG